MVGVLVWQCFSLQMCSDMIVVNEHVGYRTCNNIIIL